MITFSEQMGYENKKRKLNLSGVSNSFSYLSFIIGLLTGICITIIIMLILM